MKRTAVVALLALVVGCASVGSNGEPLGSFENPVRCDMPGGEREYLKRLRCGDGTPPWFERMGSFGLGPYGNILDGYEVKCGEERFEIFMDMYHHGHVEAEAVPGFSIVNQAS
jgi:hypothetical protein